jgi:hypothetical protein
MLIVHFRSFRLFQRPLTAGEIKPRGEQNELLRNRQGMFLGLRGHSTRRNNRGHHSEMAFG